MLWDDLRTPQDGPVPPVHFVDARGTAWFAHEIRASLSQRPRGEHYLLIESRDAIRRVWHYPADWRALRGDALLVLLDGR